MHIAGCKGPCFFRYFKGEYYRNSGSVVSEIPACTCLLSSFSVFVLFIFQDRVSLYVVLTVLELALQIILASISEICLPLPPRC